jgi:putative ABC transport system permease protein
MLWIALKMLIGDRAKYIGILLGLCFSSLIISQQSGILLGIVGRTFGFITDMSQGDIWIMDPSAQYIDDIKPMRDIDLYRVRSVEGIEWAVPLYKGMIQARLQNGTFQTCILVGIDNATLIGMPPRMVKGKVEDLRMVDAVIVNDVGAATKLASPAHNGSLSIPLSVGDTMELNDNRAYVVGICSVSRTFQSQPIIYTTYERATSFVPSQRKMLSFILGKAKSGVNHEELVKKINAQTGLAAYTSIQMRLKTIQYFAKNTGIFINFGIAIILGVIIGTAVAGQTLYNFTVGNLPYFGVFKAMGADNSILVKMVLLQALYVSAIGWGIGMGGACLFGYLARNTELSFSMPLYLYFLSFASIIMISLLSSLICIRKVIKLDPAIVFRS